MHRITRLRADTQPILRARHIDLDVLDFAIALLGAHGRLGDGVVDAEDFHGLAVARGAGFGEHDVVDGVVAFAAADGGDAGEAKTEDHLVDTSNVVGDEM